MKLAACALLRWYKRSGRTRGTRPTAQGAHNTMSYFLGIDAGGTKADYLLGDETRILARARSGTLKRLRTDAVSAARHLDGALRHLTQQSGISIHAITHTCIGTSGHSIPVVTDWLRDAFASRVSGSLLLLGDVEVALDAAFPGQPGVLILAGTGSNVAGRNHAGLLTSAGGWGPALADQGSGHRIGQESLRALFAVLDEQPGEQATQQSFAQAAEYGAPPTLLLPAVLGLWNLPSIDSLVEHANASPPPDFSQLTSLVASCASAGDQVALGVLRREAADLAKLAALVLRRLQESPSAPTSWLPPVAFAGSILEKVTPVREALEAELLRLFPGIALRPGVVDPAAGALWRARQLPLDL